MQETTVLILTPLALEFNAVVKHLTNKQPAFVHEGAAYTVGEFVSLSQKYKVVLREPGMLPVEMALATEKAIQKFRPQIAILSGIAGGIKDVRIGDVLIANKVYGHESGKEDKEGFKSRPVPGSCSRDLLAYAQILSKSDHWKNRTEDGAQKAKIWFGAIAAGNKLVTSVDSPTYQRINTHYNDTLGVEMEADGFVAALQSHPEIKGLVVRGISDKCEGKTKRSDTLRQPLAAERAAAFIFQLLYDINPSEFIDSKEPRQRAEIPSNAPVLSNPATVSTGNISIQNSTIHSEKFHQGNKIVIKHKGKGDIVSGDKVVNKHKSSPTTNHHSTNIKIPEHTLSDILKLIAQAQIEEAIKMLLDFSTKTNHPFKIEAIQISSSWHSLHSNEIRGMEHNNDMRIEKSKITDRLLKLLNKME